MSERILKSSVYDTFLLQFARQNQHGNACFTIHTYLPFIDFMILWLHGENGTGPAKFNIPHSVTLDSVGQVKTSCLELCGYGWVGMSRCMCPLFVSVAVRKTKQRTKESEDEPGREKEQSRQELQTWLLSQVSSREE